MKKFLITTLCLIMLFVITTSNTIQEVSANEKIVSNSKSAILIDVGSGNILLEQNAKERLPVASIVKLMSLAILFDKIDCGELSLDDEIKVSEYASSMGGSQMFLDVNNIYKCEDLLKSVIVASANDSIVALAEHVYGSENNFVKEMNTKSSVLSLNNTLYTDCTGLREDQYSTAEDVAKLSRIVLDHPLYIKYSQIWMEDFVHPSGRITELVNTNKLMRTFSGCIAGKTGTTDSAGYCLTAFAQRDNMKLIGVVLGADSTKNRFNDTSDLLKSGFANFICHSILSVEKPLATLNNNRFKPDSIELYPQKDFNIIEARNTNVDYETNVEIYNTNARFIKAGDVIGKAYITQNGVITGEVNIVAKVDIKMKNLKDYILDIINIW